MDGFNKWEGLDFLGPDIDALIDVQLRDGKIMYDCDPMWLWWDHNGANDDIIGWRYAEPV